MHSPNGRFVAVCGDGEYIIYTALAWRNKSYGSRAQLCVGRGLQHSVATRDSPSIGQVGRRDASDLDTNPPA